MQRFTGQGHPGHLAHIGSDLHQDRSQPDQTRPDRAAGQTSRSDNARYADFAAVRQFSFKARKRTSAATLAVFQLCFDSGNSGRFRLLEVIVSPPTFSGQAQHCIANRKQAFRYWVEDLLIKIVHRRLAPAERYTGCATHSPIIGIWPASKNGQDAFSSVRWFAAIFPDRPRSLSDRGLKSISA